MRMTTGADMQGWLDKRAGGKKDSLSIGKLTHHWDKRYFLLRGPLLHYYHSEAEIAHVDKSPGEVKCADVTVVPSPVKEVFALKTAERVLTLRADDGSSHRFSLRAAPTLRPHAALGMERLSQLTRLLNAKLLRARESRRRALVVHAPHAVRLGGGGGLREEGSSAVLCGGRSLRQ